MAHSSLVLLGTLPRGSTVVIANNSYTTSGGFASIAHNFVSIGPLTADNCTVTVSQNTMHFSGSGSSIGTSIISLETKIVLVGGSSIDVTNNTATTNFVLTADGTQAAMTTFVNVVAPPVVGGTSRFTVIGNAVSFLTDFRAAVTKGTVQATLFTVSANTELTDRSYIHVRGNTFNATNLATATLTSAQVAAIVLLVSMSNFTVRTDKASSDLDMLASVLVVGNRLVANMAPSTGAVYNSIVYMQQVGAYLHGAAARLLISNNYFEVGGVFLSTAYHSILYVTGCVFSLSEGGISVDGNRFGGSSTFTGSYACPALLSVWSSTLTGSNSAPGSSPLPLLSVSENVVDIFTSTSVDVYLSLVLCIQLTWTSSGDASVALAIHSNSMRVATNISLGSVNVLLFEFETTPLAVSGGDINIANNTLIADVAFQQASTSNLIFVCINRLHQSPTTLQHGATYRLQGNGMQVAITRATILTAFQGYIHTVIMSGALTLEGGSGIYIAGTTINLTSPFHTTATAESTLYSSLFFVNAATTLRNSTLRVTLNVLRTSFDQVGVLVLKPFVVEGVKLLVVSTAVEVLNNEFDVSFVNARSVEAMLVAIVEANVFLSDMSVLRIQSNTLTTNVTLSATIFDQFAVWVQLSDVSVNGTSNITVGGNELVQSHIPGSYARVAGSIGDTSMWVLNKTKLTLSESARVWITHNALSARSPTSTLFFVGASQLRLRDASKLWIEWNNFTATYDQGDYAGEKHLLVGFAYFNSARVEVDTSADLHFVNNTAHVAATNLSLGSGGHSSFFIAASQTVIVGDGSVEVDGNRFVTNLSLIASSSDVTTLYVSLFQLQTCDVAMAQCSIVANVLLGVVALVSAAGGGMSVNVAALAFSPLTHSSPSAFGTLEVLVNNVEVRLVRSTTFSTSLNVTAAMLIMNYPMVVKSRLTIAENTFLWDGPCDHCSGVFVGECTLEALSLLSIENNTVGMHVEAPTHAFTTVRSLQAFTLYLTVHSGTTITMTNNTVSQVYNASIYDAPLQWDPSLLDQVWALAPLYVSILSTNETWFFAKFQENAASLTAPTWLRSASLAWTVTDFPSRLYFNTSMPRSQVQHMLQIQVLGTTGMPWSNRSMIMVGNAFSSTLVQSPQWSSPTGPVETWAVGIDVVNSSANILAKRNQVAVRSISFSLEATSNPVSVTGYAAADVYIEHCGNVATTEIASQHTLHSTLISTNSFEGGNVEKVSCTATQSASTTIPTPSRSSTATQSREEDSASTTIPTPSRSSTVTQSREEDSATLTPSKTVTVPTITNSLPTATHSPPPSTTNAPSLSASETHSPSPTPTAVPTQSASRFATATPPHTESQSRSKSLSLGADSHTTSTTATAASSLSQPPTTSATQSPPTPSHSLTPTSTASHTGATATLCEFTDRSFHPLCSIFTAVSVGGEWAATCGSGVEATVGVLIPFAQWSGGRSVNVHLRVGPTFEQAIIPRGTYLPPTSFAVSDDGDASCAVTAASKADEGNHATVTLSVRFTGMATLQATTDTVRFATHSVLRCPMNTSGIPIPPGYADNGGTGADFPVSASLLVGVRVVFESAGPVPSAVEPTVDVGTAVGTVGGVVSGVPSGIVRGGMASSLRGMLRCTEFDPTDEVDLINNPPMAGVNGMGDSEGERGLLVYQRGSVVIGVGVIAASLAVVLVTCTVQVMSKAAPTWVAALTTLRMPSTLLPVALLVGEMSSGSAVGLILYRPTDGSGVVRGAAQTATDVVLAVVVLCSSWAVFVYYAYSSTIGCVVVPIPAKEDEREAGEEREEEMLRVGSDADSDEEVHAKHLHTPLPIRLLRYAMEPTHEPVLPAGTHPDRLEAGELWLRRHFFFVAERRWIAYGAAEAIVGSLVDVVEGVPLTSRSLAACAGRPALMAALLLVLVVLLVWKWPMAVRMQQWGALCINGLLLLTAVLITANVFAVSIALEEAASYLLMCSSLLITLFSLMDVVCWLLMMVPSLRMFLGLRPTSLGTALTRMRSFIRDGIEAPPPSSRFQLEMLVDGANTDASDIDFNRIAMQVLMHRLKESAKRPPPAPPRKYK